MTGFFQKSGWLLLVLPIGLLTQLGFSDWPNQRGNAAATGVADKPLSETPNVVWKTSLSDAIEATPVIADGRVYVGDFEGKFVCLSLADGKQIWETKIPAAKAAAAVGNGKVVVGDLDGLVHALDATTGKPLWQFDLGGVIDSGPTLVDQHALIASQAGELVCLEVADGKEVWRYQTSDQIRCSPTVANGRVFLGGCDGQLHQVDVATGKAATDPVPLDGPTGSTPAVQGDLAVVPTYGGMVYAINWRSGEKAWEYTDTERDQEFRLSAAVTPEVAVVTSQNKLVAALDLKTGKELWREVLRRRADAAPVIAGNAVFIAATDGQLLRFDLKTGEPTWKFEIRGSFLASPAISQGRMIAVTDKGDIMCFE